MTCGCPAAQVADRDAQSNNELMYNCAPSTLCKNGSLDHTVTLAASPAKTFVLLLRYRTLYHTIIFLSLLHNILALHQFIALL